MLLKIMLPSEIYLSVETAKIIAQAENGEFCLKPRHIDFVSTLAPGILSYTNDANQTVYIAVDSGVLVKCGNEVTVSTLHALTGKTLQELKQIVREHYEQLTEREQAARSAMSRLEAGVMRSLIQLEGTLR